jgi:hypothetical protein
MSMKNSNDTIGNRTRDPPACSAVRHPTAPPRAPDNIKLINKLRAAESFMRSNSLSVSKEIPLTPRSEFVSHGNKHETEHIPVSQQRNNALLRINSTFNVTGKKIPANTNVNIVFVASSKMSQNST